MQRIVIELMNGDTINCNLYEEYAPLTVANFMHLVDIEFYNSTIFHRIIAKFMSQGGGYVSDTAAQKLVGATPGYTIPGEFGANGWPNPISHVLGTLSMARTDDPNSASSQFFICDENAKFLDGQYAAFGTVADEASLAIVRKINSLPTITVVQNMQDFPNCALDQVTIKTIHRSV